MARVLADVYLEGGRNVRLPTTPGRSIQFTGGHCMVVDGRDMPHVLQMDGAKVHPRPDAMPWAPEWLAHTDWIRAEVNWPEGWSVDHNAKDDFKINGPDIEVDDTRYSGQASVTPPVPTVDMTDRQSERPLRIQDLLAESDEEQDAPKRRKK